MYRLDTVAMVLAIYKALEGRSGQSGGLFWQLRSTYTCIRVFGAECLLVWSKVII